MKQTIDYQKEQCRGFLKQVMKVRGLRTISIANYLNWLRSTGNPVTNGYVHSLKLDLQDGYINAYGYGVDGKCGEKIEDCETQSYQYAMMVVNNMIANENKIPYKVKRNIFVKLAR